MTDNSKKKKIIIGSVVGAVFLVSALAIGITINIKNEKEAQEVARLEQEKKEKEAQELKKQQEQQEQEEKERQEKLLKWNNEWNALGENQEYLALGSEYFYREGEANINGSYSFHITEEFLGTLFTICDGWYNGATVEDLRLVLNSALASLPNNATAQETYEAFVSYTEMVNRDAVITGEGQNPYDILVKNEPTQNTQQPNSNTTGNGSSNSNKNTNSNSNSNSNSNTPPSDSSDKGVSQDEAVPDGWTVDNGPDEWSEDQQGGVEGGLMSGGN